MRNLQVNWSVNNLVGMVLMGAHAVLGSIGLAWAAYEVCVKKPSKIERRDDQVKQNLEEQAIFSRSLGGSRFDCGFDCDVVNKDIDGDGRYESLLQFRRGDGSVIEKQHIERRLDGGFRIRPYEVVDGEVKYLD